MFLYPFIDHALAAFPVPSSLRPRSPKPIYLSFAQNNDDLGRSEQELKSRQATLRQATGLVEQDAADPTGVVRLHRPAHPKQVPNQPVDPVLADAGCRRYQ